MSGRTKFLAGLLSALAMVALCISLYLTWSSWQTTAVAGCRGDGTLDCDQVLTSHWSRWLGLPVSLLGSLIYVSILAICWPAVQRPRGKAGNGLLALSLLAAGAAVWFIVVQAVFLQSFCLYCLSVHACGLSIAGITLLLMRGTKQEVDYDQLRSLLGVDEPATSIEQNSKSLLDESYYPLVATGLAAVGLALLMGGQFLFIPEGLVVETFVKHDSLSAEQHDPLSAEEEDQTFESIAVDHLMKNAATTDDGATGAKDIQDLLGSKAEDGTSPGSRRLSFHGLQQSIDITKFPLLGNPNAPHVIVEMLDYTCHHCRHLHPYIESALEQYGDQVAFVIQHVPLSSRCNRHIIKDHPSKKDACDLARLAIGVWKLAPEEFPEFHSWLMKSEKPPSIFEARKRALSIAGEGVLIDDSLKADLSRRITKQCDAANRLKKGLPTLLTAQSVVKGVPSTEKQWTKFIEGQLGSQTAK